MHQICDILLFAINLIMFIVQTLFIPVWSVLQISYTRLKFDSMSSTIWNFYMVSDEGYGTIWFRQTLFSVFKKEHLIDINTNLTHYSMLDLFSWYKMHLTKHNRQPWRQHNMYKTLHTQKEQQQITNQIQDDLDFRMVLIFTHSFKVQVLFSKLSFAYCKYLYLSV